MKLSIYVGTRGPARRIEIDTDKYGERFPVGASEHDMRIAATELENLLNQGGQFIADHHRNHDAVNGCIALHVLGYDPEPWFEKFFEDPNVGRLFRSRDVVRFLEHVERVSGYVGSWGPKGNESLALEYMV